MARSYIACHQEVGERERERERESLLAKVAVDYVSNSNLGIRS